MVYINACLYVAMGATGFLVVYLGTDDAAKYFDAKNLFIANMIIGCIDAMLLALKLFLSTTFAEHKESKKSLETQFIQK